MCSVNEVPTALPVSYIHLTLPTIYGTFKLMQPNGFRTYCSVGTGNRLGSGERGLSRVGSMMIGFNRTVDHVENCLHQPRVPAQSSSIDVLCE